MGKEDKGIDWFEIKVCAPCTRRCDGTEEETLECIEAEKLRVLTKISESLEYLGD